LNDKKVLVIGGGIAGLSCANHLRKLGLPVVLIEKTPYVGGQALHFFCKATTTCQKCNYCLVEEQFFEVLGNPGIEILTRTALSSAEPVPGGGYQVTLIRKPSLINPTLCNNCGACYEVCPAVEDGAIVKGIPSSATHPIYSIHEEACLYFKDKKARLCQDRCPEKAINLDQEPQTLSLKADAIVVATGYTPFDPGVKPRLGYGEIPNVVTALELEEMIRVRSEVLRPSDQKPPRRVAFIQCIGSRDKSLDHAFCSRVCCGYALRMAQAIKHRRPETEVFVFYMDIQNFGKDFIPLYKAARETLTLVRGIPGQVIPAAGDGVALGFQEDGGGPPRQEVFDLVVLSIGLMPSTENAVWADLFGLPSDEDGFLGGLDTHGVFVAGTAGGPMDIAESITHGGLAASRVAHYLGF
jgi:heterodisulfide reductase subunit A